MILKESGSFPHILEFAKNNKLAWVQSTENGDMPPTVIGIKNNAPIICCVSPAVDKKLGLIAVRGIHLFCNVDQIAIILDAHRTNLEGKSKEEQDRIIKKYVGKPGSMQKACDEEGACSLGEIVDCLTILSIKKGGEEKMASMSYSYHGRGSEFKWLPELDVDNVDIKSLGGYMIENMRAILAEPTIYDHPVSKAFIDGGSISKEKAIEVSRQNFASIMMKQGFIVQTNI